MCFRTLCFWYSSLHTQKCPLSFNVE
ncbi:MAG: hypothetical protein ACI90V_007335, partial [Bacillariaceae sp.]